MPSNIKHYKLDDFIKETPTGDVDLEKTLKLVRDLVTAEREHPNHAAIIDLRKVVGYLTFEQLVPVINEFAKYKELLKNKIALLVPIDVKRMARMIHVRSCLTAQGFEVEVFVEYEDAIEWLSEVTELDSDDN